MRSPNPSQQWTITRLSLLTGAIVLLEENRSAVPIEACGQGQ
jgi:hypothetical protein